MDYLAKKTLAEARERRGKAAQAAPEPVSGPVPKTKTKTPPPAPKVDTGKLESLIKQVLETQAALMQAMQEMTAAKRATPTYTVRITSRDGNRNIKSLTVRPDQPDTLH